ncbi:hypothetical protein ACQSSU_24495 [Micromonospora echinospora]
MPAEPGRAVPLPLLDQQAEPPVTGADAAGPHLGEQLVRLPRTASSRAADAPRAANRR